MIDAFRDALDAHTDPHLFSLAYAGDATTFDDVEDAREIAVVNFDSARASDAVFDMFGALRPDMTRRDDDDAATWAARQSRELARFERERAVAIRIDLLALALAGILADMTIALWDSETGDAA